MVDPEKHEAPRETEMLISSEPQVGDDCYQTLLSAWKAASPEDRTRFLAHIGARLLS
jgi:hypothetical protein